MKLIDYLLRSKEGAFLIPVLRAVQAALDELDARVTRLEQLEKERKDADR